MTTVFRELPRSPGQNRGFFTPEQSFISEVFHRLIRPDGRPSVKIATTEQGSGIDLSGGMDPTYIVLSSDGGETSLTLTNKDGRRQVIRP